MEVRPLTEADAQAFWDLRTTALQTEPDAFGESVEEHLQKSVEEVSYRLRKADDKFVLGAVSGSTLVGTVGFYRETRMKRRHLGWIWGMFLLPKWRGQGLGRQLLKVAIRRASAISDLERILLSVSTTQSAARHLYASLGFVAFGLEPQALQIEGRFITQEHMALPLRTTGSAV